MRSLLYAAAVLAIPSVAIAETYDVLSWNGERLAVADKASVVATGDLRRVRTTVVFSRPQGEGDRTRRGLVGVQEFDCANARFRTLESLPFDDSGAALDALAVREPTAWTAVAAGTLADDERVRVCAGQWSSRTYATKLQTLMAAYLLMPAAAGVQTAQTPRQAPDATSAGVDVAVTAVP